MDCLTRRFQDTKHKEDKSEKVEQKIELNNKEGGNIKEVTSSKIESKEAENIVNIESREEKQNQIQCSVKGDLEKDLEVSPERENKEDEKSAFMISGICQSSLFLNKTLISYTSDFSE